MFCKQWWESKTGILIFEGYHEEGEWNASAARNRAAAQAGDWDVGIFCDSDTITFPIQLGLAVKLAQKTGRVTLPFMSRIELLDGQTKRFISKGELPSPRYMFPIFNHPSGIVIVPRKLWDSVGGFDEGFVGWGCQDSDFLWRCESLWGKANRVHGSVYHLWHARPPDAIPDSLIYLNNRKRLREKHGNRTWDSK